MTRLPDITRGSLFFAPMEGITDGVFRKTILDLYPEWDYLACDFLRVPSAGKYPIKYLVKHFGTDLFKLNEVKNNTLFQILTSHRAFTSELIQDLEDLKIPWVDINLGCPSNTVCKNGGGSFLLTDLKKLRPLIQNIRSIFKGRLSAKIRIGYSNTLEFEDSIKLLNDEGIDLVTVHGRTRDQMYKEPANWKFIERAVEISSVPIIGNGDIWKTQDIDRMLNETGCFGVMVARGALQSPWMARDYKQKNFTETTSYRLKQMSVFFNHYKQELEKYSISERGLLKQSKSVSRFMLSPVPNGEVIRRKLMLAQTSKEFYEIINHQNWDIEN